MTESDDPLTFDQIIRLRNQRWESSITRPGEILKFKNRCVPMPKIEELSIYRGQTKDHGKLRSGMYRNQDPYVQAISRAKQKEFEVYLSDVPAFSKILSYGVPIGAVAQHYGLVTEYLDVSGSFAVAMFFAACTYDEKKGRYRPLNHKEIKENPFGVIYTTMIPAIPYDDLEIVGFSPLNRPSCQHSVMIRDRDDGNLDGLFFKQSFEHSIRLSKEMFRFFDNGNGLFPLNDSSSIKVLAAAIKNSKVVNRGYYLDACRDMGLTGTDEELMSCSGDYSFNDTVPKPSPQDMMEFSIDIERADFVRNSGMQFSARLSYTGGREQ